MSDAITSGSSSKPPEAKIPGIVRPEISQLDAFKSPAGTGGTVTGGRPASGGKSGSVKNKGGRPPKNNAGFSREKIEEISDDPDIEAAREEFEECIVSLLVSTTDNIADARFLLLKTQYPEAEAKGLADKARLTDKEKKWLGKIGVRLWRKYLGDEYLFSDEAIAGMYFAQYFLRNLEPMNQANKIHGNIASRSNKQPGLQGQISPNFRSEENGKIDTNSTSHSFPSRAASPGV